MSDLVVTTGTELLVCPHDGLGKGLKRVGKNRYIVLVLPSASSITSRERFDEYVRFAHAINGAPADLRQTCCVTNLGKTIVAIWIPDRDHSFTLPSFVFSKVTKP